MELVRLVLLVVAIPLFLFGFAVWVSLRNARQVTPELRFAPIWKQGPMFASRRSYRRYLVGTLSVLLALLLISISFLLTWV